MKKVFCLILILVLALPVVAVGEGTFSVRNGVEFGMTKEQVKAIEENNGVTSFEEDEEGLGLYFNTTVAGIEDCRVVYTFSENKLKHIGYTWLLGKQADEKYNAEVERFYKNTNFTFDTLEATLSEKYELIGQKTGAKEYSFVDFGTLGFPFMEDQSEYIGAEYTIYGFKQYLTSSGEDYVEIAISNEYDTYYLFGEPFHNQAACFVVYNFIPKETYDTVIQDAKNKEAQRQNDL